MNIKCLLIFIVVFCQNFQIYTITDKVNIQKDYRTGLLYFGSSMALYGVFVGSGNPVLIGLSFCSVGASVVDEQIKEDPNKFIKDVYDIIRNNCIISDNFEVIKDKSEVIKREKFCENIKFKLMKIIEDKSNKNISSIVINTQCKDTNIQNISYEKSALYFHIIGNEIHIKYNEKEIGEKLIINQFSDSILTGVISEVIERTKIKKINISCHENNCKTLDK